MNVITVFFSFIILLIVISSDVDARTKNPPGCKNSGPQAHNPNCSGGSGTHIPAKPESKPVEIKTIKHSSSTSKSGGATPATPGNAPNPKSATPATPAQPANVVNAPSPKTATPATPAQPSNVVDAPSPQTAMPATPAQPANVVNAPSRQAATPATPAKPANVANTPSQKVANSPISAAVEPSSSINSTSQLQVEATQSAQVAPAAVVSTEPSVSQLTTTSASATVTSPGSSQPETTLAESATPISPVTSSFDNGSASPAPSRSIVASASNPDHGEKMVNYSNHIVPENPLHMPELRPHLQAPAGADIQGRSGIAIATMIEAIPHTDIEAGQLPSPVTGYGHEDGATGGRTGGQGDKFIHVQRHDGEPKYNTHVPPKPGKNFIPGYRAFLVSSSGKRSACVMSGMGKRTIVNEDGQAASYGHSETIHFRSSSTAHLPSNHQTTSRCLVSVSK